MKKLLSLLLLMAGLVVAQPGNPVVQFRSTNPAGACSPQPMWYNYALGNLYGCVAGTWTLVAASTGGTPTGPAGGDLTGTYPNPTIAKVSGITAGTIVGVDGANAVTGIDYSAASAPSVVASRDSSENSFANSWVNKQVAVAAAAGNTVLTKASAPHQILTGTGNQTFTLPNAATFLQTGVLYRFANNATGTLTINTNGGSLLTTVPTLGAAVVINTSVASAPGTWDVRYEVPLSMPAHYVLGNNTGSAAVPNTVQLACADLSDAGTGCSATSGITALTGDVTATGPGSVAATVVNLPSGVTQAGYLAATAIVAPSTPGAGLGRVYVDSTSKNISVKDDAGVVKHGVQTDTGTANNYISAISDAGVITKSRPTCSTLSDAGAGCTAGAATAQVFAPGGSFVNAGSAIAATTISLPWTAPSACTIRAWVISVPAAESGTLTVKFLKVAAGTSSPAIGDSINTSGVALSSGDHVRSTTLSDFTTTAVTQGDVIAVALTAVAGGLTGATANVECQ